MKPHAAIVLGLLATASVAETPPALVPAQDVTVTYDAPARWGGRPMRTAAGGRLVRSDVDAAGLPRMAVIHDHAAREQTIMLLEERQYMVIPFPTGMPAGPDPDTVYQRLGTRSIAELSCTDWLMHPKDSAELRTTICLTDDGVMLRRESEFGEPFLAVARHVEFGPIDPDWFTAPENFNRIGPPEDTAPARP